MIHKYQYGSRYLLLDVNSGAVHVIDALTYDVLDYYDDDGNCQTTPAQICAALAQRHPSDRLQEEINEAMAEIAALKEQKILFAADEFAPIGDTLARKNPVVKALCLHIAHDCNLKCKYCFAGEGEYGGARQLMSAEVGKKALDFIVQNSGARKNLEVDFFGGEPTLNFDVVKEIVEYGRTLEAKNNKKFRFTLTTNAVLLTDEMIAFANEQMHNVVLSIDGRPEVNDRMRPDKGGSGSYQKILPNIRKLVDARASLPDKTYYVRGTFTRNNLDFSQDVLHLADLGFDQISIEPVVAPPEADYSLREEDLPVLFGEYDRLSAEMKRRCSASEAEHPPFHFFHFNIDLTGGSCAIKRISGCGAGCEYMAVTPDGGLYPCHQFAGMEDFKLGTVFDGITQQAIVERFNSVNVYQKEECRSCWAKFYCSGGCAANAYQFSGDITGNYRIGCELQKKRVECAIDLQVEQML